MRTSIGVVLAGGFLFAASNVFAAGLEVLGQLSHDALSEVSGIVKSPRGDFYWVHNDSGDGPRLFAIDADGTPLYPPFLGLAVEDWEGHVIDGATHFDWEDIAQSEGVLYIADVGNNGNARRDLGVYVVNEPDPLAIPRMRALRYLPVRYPDQTDHPGDVWHFDCEAVFVADGKLHFLTKHRQSRRIREAAPGTKLYRLDTQYADRENVLTLIGRRDDVSQVTGADLSPDGARLAVATYTTLWIFDRPGQGGDWLSGEAWKLEMDSAIAKQLEAIAWQDASTLRLVNEQRDVLAARVDDFEPVLGSE